MGCNDEQQREKEAKFSFISNEVVKPFAECHNSSTKTDPTMVVLYSQRFQLPEIYELTQDCIGSRALFPPTGCNFSGSDEERFRCCPASFGFLLRLAETPSL